MFDIIRNHPRPTEELLQAFSGIQAATLHEAMGKRGALSHEFRPAYPGAHILGSALTVKSGPRDNLMLHKAVSVAQPGDVLIANVDGFLEAGVWGEIITRAAMMKGITGIVTDGAVRDTEPIEALGFPMFSRGISMRGTSKVSGGTVNHPIEIGGVLVKPGDIIVGDSDGVVVVPLEEAEDVLRAAHAKEEAEAGIMARVEAGECTLDVLNIRKAFDSLGLTEEP